MYINGAYHGDKANIVARKGVEQATAGQAVQDHVEACHGLDYPARRGSAG